MSEVRASDHFLPVDALPEFDVKTPFYKVYSELHRRGVSGFVIASHRGTRRYVNAFALAETALKESEQTAARAARSRPSLDLVRSVSATAIGSVVEFEWARPTVLVIPAAPVDAEADAEPLQKMPDMVFQIQSQGRAVGWFLNHETVMSTATGKTVFICENNHENPDSDHGTCYQCPGDIVRAEKRS